MGSRQETNHSTRQPTAQELVSNSSGLLSSALTEGTGRLYQSMWVIFRQFYAQFYGSSNPTLPLSPVCLPLYTCIVMSGKIFHVSSCHRWLRWLLPVNEQVEISLFCTGHLMAGFENVGIYCFSVAF